MGVLKAIAESLANIWYMLVGLSSLGFFIAFGMGWVDVRKKKGGEESEKKDAEEKEDMKV
jgi:hypothetical protein